jgi:hypothetical protein
MAGGFFAISISGKEPAGIEASLLSALDEKHRQPCSAGLPVCTEQADNGIIS